MDCTILSFLKFGQEEHIRDLYENGTVYLNSLNHFKKVEDEELRGDKYEGANKVINSLPGTFKIPGIDREFKYQKIHIVESHEYVMGNIYSLYCISSHTFSNPADFKIDERNTRFGTHCLVIENLPYFMDKMKIELKKTGRKFWYGFVKYFDKDTTSKDLDPFDKPSQFEYQKEFRFFVESKDIEPLIITLGSLKEHAELIKIEDAMQMKLVPKSI